MGKTPESDIEKVEHLLFFYQKTCKHVLDKDDAVAAMAFQSNVAIAAVDAYITNKSAKDKMPAVILVATKPHYDQMVGMGEKFFGADFQIPKPACPGGASWLDYGSDAVAAKLLDAENRTKW